ncbi:E3 ISG15--protein ligase HERC5-like [Pithys albifrons albifrons]|uniref:E3 ISG15--protein ligase HERC5-like n=1 Tax=Pithys albifrons albifrons TaxID=3385563 RepID=UPI003A5CE5CA
MATARRRERRRGREHGTGEHTQLQRSEKAQCSNHDATHTLILSHDGKVYEHWAKAPANCSKQRLVKELGSLNIVQIACGDQHAMALSRGGELFTWGQNAHGQLGVGSQTTFIPEAQLVERLKGIPLAQIAAGGAHSITVSLSGFVYSWGKNDCGQLGLGDTEDRDCPSYVGALEHWKTVFIACGADHTAVLSKEGLVCTFGAGGAGQLGHNSTRNELVPRVVAELWGARVSQVACGRQHTLVYVPSLEKFYFFGSGDEGWPEDERKPNQLIPLPINPPVNTGNSCQKNNTSQKGIKITTGVNRSFVLCKENKNSYLNGIATLEDKKVDEWISSSNSKDRERIKKNIRLIFSSEACINGSFLEKRDKHFKTSKEVSGVDMSEVKYFYKKIREKPELFQQGKDVRSYWFLILLGQAIMKLQPKDLQTLEYLWSNLEISFFNKLVILYQGVSQETLSQFIMEVKTRGPREPFTLKSEEAVSLQILQMLYQVNSRTGFRVQESHFYVPPVREIMMLCQHFNTAIALWKLSKYPCIFNTQNKINLHVSEHMILATERRFLSTECSVPSLTHTNIPFTLVQRKWEFRVRRECFLQDIRNNLESASSQEFRKTLWVVFVGEQGRDGGGLAQELFSVAARTICQPGTGTSAFCRFASGLVWFPSKASGCEDDDTFFFIGTLCGMALYNIRVVPLPFPRALYKKLLGLAPTLEDLEELLPTVGRNLWGILNEECDRTLKDMDLRFTIMEEEGSMDVVKLKENGANIPVTKDNRKEYVDLYVNYVLNESVQKPFQDFMRGFLRGCPARNWKIFLPVELQVVLQGHTTFDWYLLEKNVIYKQYNKSDQTIKDFWTVFHELSEEKKKMFLGFLSGSDRIPGNQLECFRFFIVDPQVENPDEFYPCANTCSLIFFLPRYSSKSILEEKLLCAIEHNEGFGWT